uniref:Neuroguidin n=1 Tax=Parastrongyloides trichosuri TaxID=131310 RepID=A0A0N4ZUK5_PARTI
MTEEDSIRYEEISKECLSTSEELLEAVKVFSDEIKNPLPVDGISLLDLKNHDMTLYLCEMLHLMTLMSNGDSIQNNEAVDRLIYLRVILERIRPIENKMRSQIDSLLTSKDTTNKEVSMKARPNMLVLSDDSEESEVEEGETKKYKAPKIMPTKMIDEDEDKNERALQKAKKRALQSSLLSDLRAQYSNAPEEIVDKYDDEKLLQRQKRIERFENENFRRITGKKAASLRQDKQSDALDKLLEFGDYMGAKEGPKTRKRKGRLPTKKNKKKRF